MMGMMTCLFKRSRLLPEEGAFAEMQDQSGGRLAILENDPLAPERQVLYTYIGELVLLRGQ